MSCLHKDYCPTQLEKNNYLLLTRENFTLSQRPPHGWLFEWIIVKQTVGELKTLVLHVIAIRRVNGNSAQSAGEEYNVMVPPPQWRNRRTFPAVAQHGVITLFSLS